MTTIFSVGDKVYVPASKLGIESAVALKETKVLAVNDRSVTVDVPGGGVATVGSKLVHKSVSVVIFRIGDYSTEETLLNPLTKSLLQYCRLLIPDDHLKLEQLRTADEFREIWHHNHGIYTHVILVGHCDGTRMTFGTNHLTVDDLDKILTNANSDKKSFISLACHSGKAGFARAFSDLACCRSFIDPFQSCQGAVASTFGQTLLARHFLDGMTLKTAFNKSQNLPGGTSFRFWKDGQIQKSTRKTALPTPQAPSGQ